MARMDRIEVQDQFGHWRRFQTAIASDTSIKLALQRALKTQLASKSRKARAIDDKICTLIDILER